MVVVVVVVLGGEGGCAIYFVQNHHTLSQRDSSLRKNLDTCSNSACALEGHVDWQKGRIMAVRPACAFCRAGAAGPSKRYSDMLLDTTTPLLWMPRISVENQSEPNDESLTRGWYTSVPTARKPRCLLLVTSLAKLQSRSTTMFRSASADNADAAAAGGGGKARELEDGGGIGCLTTRGCWEERRGERITGVSSFICVGA